MNISILGFISNIFKPAAKLIDDVHTSEEERMQLKKELLDVENKLSMKVLEYESQLLQAQSSIITAEATGQSWLQRSWRPITMLTFLALVVLDTFDIGNLELNNQAWALLKIGLGGYVIGRSAEKIVPTLKGAMKKDEAKG